MLRANMQPRSSLAGSPYTSAVLSLRMELLHLVVLTTRSVQNGFVLKGRS